MNICKFGILRYVPDEDRQEFINIGVVLHSPEEKFIDCIMTKNFSRVTAFDDEVDIAFLKIVLEGVSDDFSKTSTISGPSFEDLADWNYLEKSTSIYVNQLQFSEIRTIRSDDFERDLLNLFKVYVYFEVQKNSRITEFEVKSIMNRVIKSKTNSILNSNFNRNIKVDIGAEQIELDYAYKTKNENIKIIKTFSFDYTNKGSKQAAQLAKEWAYNFSKIKTKIHLEKTFQTDKRNIELATLIYLNNINKNVSVALQILKEEARTHEVRSEGEIIQFADKMMDELQLSID